MMFHYCGIHNTRTDLAKSCTDLVLVLVLVLVIALKLEKRTRKRWIAMAGVETILADVKVKRSSVCF